MRAHLTSAVLNLGIVATGYALVLTAGCGTPSGEGRPATEVPPQAQAPMATAAPATVAPAAITAAAPIAARPATAAAPLLLDLASPTVLHRLKASGQADAKPQVAIDAGRPALEFSCTAGADWPGLAILPENGVWDLSASGGVVLEIANAGTVPADVGLRVDQQGGPSNAWNGDGAKLAPGATAAIRVLFGHSWGKPAFAIDPARIGRILVYAAKPGEGCRLRIRSLAATGKPGDKPASAMPRAIVTRRLPADPVALSFAGGIDRARLQTTGVEISAVGDPGRQTALITASASAAKAELLYRPAKALDLRDFNQATFVVRNPGTAPVRVACRLQGAQADDRVTTEAELAPGERREVVVPFASGAAWQGVSPAKPDAPRPGAAFTGAPTEQSSVGLVSDAVAAMAVAMVGSASGAQVAWEGVTAGTSGPAQLPEWLGTRPPVEGDWVRIMADEFDGSELDTSRWTPRLPWIGPIPYEFQRYNDKNVIVRDGHLVIRCEKRTGTLYDNPAWPARDYTTGAVTTYPRWSMHYGYTEARMKLPKALGLWPAFWTMPDRGPLPSATASTGDWLSIWEAARTTPDKNRRRSTDVDGMEFDIMEHCTRFGPFRYNIAGHWDGYGKDHKSVGTSRIYSQPDKDGYIVAGLLWEPGRLTWYCNGRKVGTWADARVGSVPASLKFTVQMGGWAGNEVDDAALPDDFRIDWVRVWQLRERLGGGAAMPKP